MEPLDHRKWLKEHQPNHAVCSYVIEGNLNISSNHNDVCHARARPSSWNFGKIGDEVCTISSALPHKCKKEAAKEYYDFLFSVERSPYRSILKDKDVELVSEGDKLYGFTFRKPDVPSVVLFNLLISSRLPWEFPNEADLFYELIHEHKFQDFEAWYIANYVSLYKDGSIKNNNYSGHRCLNVAGNHPIHNLADIRDGKLNVTRNDSKMLYSKMGCWRGQCNTIWESDPPPGKVTIFNIDGAEQDFVYKGRFINYVRFNMDDVPFELYDPYGVRNNAIKKVTVKDLVRNREKWSI